LHTGTATAQRIRQRFVEGNLEGALNEHPRPGGGNDGRCNSWPTAWWR
jgi:hypothetical protein